MRNAVTCWMATRLQRWADDRIITARPPDFVVGGTERPYLLRWWVIPRNPLLNVYVHVFLRDDDDRALHDHPWWSLSLSLGPRPLVEHYRGWFGRHRVRLVEPGHLIARRGRFAHRMVVPDGPALTLFVTGPRYRRWGFLCPQGWRHWRKFTAPARSGEIGRGCD